MFCIKCGKKISDEANFCNFCGYKVIGIEDKESKDESEDAKGEADSDDKMKKSLQKEKPVNEQVQLIETEKVSNTKEQNNGFDEIEIKENTDSKYGSVSIVNGLWPIVYMLVYGLFVWGQKRGVVLAVSVAYGSILGLICGLIAFLPVWLLTDEDFAGKVKTRILCLCFIAGALGGIVLSAIVGLICGGYFVWKAKKVTKNHES